MCTLLLVVCFHVVSCTCIVCLLFYLGNTGNILESQVQFDVPVMKVRMCYRFRRTYGLSLPGR